MIEALKVCFNKFCWSLRRVRIAIPPDALVLEVGSGGNPYPRANVLLDAYEETRERHWDSLIKDRPTILSFGENLPFRDKVFDYVIAAHVLEHSPYPEKFLSELQRVARAGYIETPDAFMERINPYKDHRLEVTVRGDELIIRKKPAWIYDSDLVELYEHGAKPIIAVKTISRYPDNFHARYFWRDKIKFRIVNPEVDAGWNPLISHDEGPFKLNVKSKIRFAILRLIRGVFSQSNRNSRLDILSLLRCPNCHSEVLKKSSDASIVCECCNKNYKILGSLFQMH